MSIKDGNLKEVNICGKCGCEASYYIDELKMWLCEECLKEEENIAKENEKLEKKISRRAYSFDVSELLESLSKDEIYNIARNLGLAKISGVKKDELVKRLVEEYEGLIKLRLELFDEERYHFLREYLKNNKVKKFTDIDELEAEQSTYFIQQGFLYPTVNSDGEGVFLMPDAVKSALESFDNLDYRRIIKHNTDMINTFRGMNRAYGILKFDTIKSMFDKFGIDKITNLEELLKEAGYYYSEYREEGKCFINNYIQNLSDVEKEINKNEELEFAAIPKSELVIMSKENYNLELKCGKEFYKEFSNTFESSKDMIQTLMDELSIEIQENDINDSIELILNEMEVEDENIKATAGSMMIKFANKVRMWKYKGNTANDMKVLNSTVQKQVSIGRNDPCICGSGKKYKKCCGKNK